MAHPDHQKYWRTVAAGSGVLGGVMIAAGAAVGSTRPFSATGGFMIAAYVAFAGAGVFFVCYLRQWRFPFAVDPPPPVTQETAIVDSPPPSTQVGVPDEPTWADVDKDLDKLRKFREGQTGP